MKKELSRFGDRLVVEAPLQALQSERYRREVEKLMEREIRKLKWQKTSYWVVAPLLLAESIYFAMKIDDAGATHEQIRYLWWALSPFLFVMLIQIQYAASRNALEIRKEIRELIQAMKETRNDPAK